MKLRDLILELASIDNTQNLPQRELLDFDVEIHFDFGDKSVLTEVLSIYCSEKHKKIFIDME